jgi:hypothetical protein
VRERFVEINPAFRFRLRAIASNNHLVTAESVLNKICRENRTMKGGSGVCAT